MIRWLGSMLMLAWCVAATAASIELRDGSVVQGEVISLADGVYTVRTRTLGVVEFDQEDVVAVRYGGSAGHISAGSATAGTLDPVQTQAIAGRLMSDPAIMEMITAEKKKGRISETRFKGLGEMNPLQLRESTIDPDTRRVVQLTIGSDHKTNKVMDMLLSKKRASDRKAWLEDKGDLATV